MVRRSVREDLDTKTRESRRTLAQLKRCADALTVRKASQEAACWAAHAAAAVDRGRRWQTAVSTTAGGHP